MKRLPTLEGKQNENEKHAKGFAEHGLRTFGYIEEQTVSDTLYMVIEAILQCQQSWVVQPRDVIVSHQTEFTKPHKTHPF